MTPLDYHCKICGKPGVAYYDPNCPITMLESWRKALCCDRCYKFRDGYITAKRAVEKQCIQIISTRQIRDDNVKKEALNKLRDRLIQLTRRIVSLCSDYYHVQNVWNMQMVMVLMEKPEGCNKALDAFHAGYRQVAKQS